MPSRIRLSLLLLVCGAAWHSSVALVVAQEAPANASPRELVEQGYFEQALLRVDALMAEGPQRLQLVELLEVRAMVQLALGQTDALRMALAQLVALAPDYASPNTASPDFAAEVARARQASPGPLSAQLRAGAPAEPMRAELINDPGGLGVRAGIRSRVAAGPWRTHSASWTPDDAEHDVQAQGVVLGGAGQVLYEGRIQTVGGQSEALNRRLSPLEVARDQQTVSPPPESSPESSLTRRRVAIGVTLGALAVAGIVLGVVLSQRGETRYVPVLDW